MLASPVLKRVPPSAQADVQSAVAILLRDPEVRRIRLFGSLAKGREPDFRSDLDLAVEGLSSARYLSVWAALDQALRLSPDLVRWEEANDTLRAEIERWGIILYERT
jgi:predicted nucleotidyltransferase